MAIAGFAEGESGLGTLIDRWCSLAESDCTQGNIIYCNRCAASFAAAANRTRMQSSWAAAVARTGDVELGQGGRGDAGGQGITGVVGQSEGDGVGRALWQVDHAPRRDALHERQQRLWQILCILQIGRAALLLQLSPQMHTSLRPQN